MQVPPPPQLPGAALEGIKKRRSKRRQTDTSRSQWPALKEGQERALEVGEVLTPAANTAAVSRSRVSSTSSEGPQMDWMIHRFKTMPCKVQMSASSHDHRCCPYYHSERDRRRPLFGDEESIDTVPGYISEPCNNRFDDSRSCLMGDNCDRCHSTAELLYHPSLFKKRLCHQLRRCPRGKYCAFAHARHELLVPSFTEEEETDPTEEFIAHRFKTQWCPIGGPHDWESCVYAHTYRDWRRSPLLGYSSHPCPRWSGSITKGLPELDYGMRCPHGVACPLAHGAKEQLYHPHFYKTSPCSDPNCRRGPLCAFTHGEDDIRKLMGDAFAKVARKPIAEAQLILAQHQPTFSAPPMYHALEDAPKAGTSKSRRQRGRGAVSRDGLSCQLPSGMASAETLELPAPEVQALSLPASPQGLQLPPGFQVPYQAEVMPFATNPYLSPCMWLPLGTQGNQMGSYFQESQSPVAMPENQMFWGGYSPLSPDSGGAGLSGTSPAAFPCVLPAYPCVPSDASPANSSEKKLMAGQEFVNLASWRNNGVRDVDTMSNGWRTQSSFGSRPPSVGQSAPSTPRSCAEKAESTASGGSNCLDSETDPSQSKLVLTGEVAHCDSMVQEPMQCIAMVQPLALQAR